MCNSLKAKLVLALVVFLLLNCFGYCWGQFRFLSDQERIEIAVRRSVPISQSGHTVKSMITTKHSGWKRIDEIPYKSLKEFFLLNPNCCKVTREVSISEGVNFVTLIGCITGLAPYFVSGKYEQRYMENEVISTRTSGFIYRMSSCGDLRHPHIRQFFDIWNWS